MRLRLLVMQHSLRAVFSIDSVLGGRVAGRHLSLYPHQPHTAIDLADDKK
jgi:hypothetical protein